MIQSFEITDEAETDQAAVKTGRFSAHEDSVINQILEEFKASSGVTDEELCPQLREENAGRGHHYSVLKKLYAALPNRGKKAVHARVMRLITMNSPDFIKGNWDAESRNELRRLNAEHNNNWAKIGRLMKRHPNAIRDQWKTNSDNETRENKGKFSTEESSDLVAAVLKVSCAETMDQGQLSDGLESHYISITSYSSTSITQAP